MNRELVAENLRNIMRDATRIKEIIEFAKPNPTYEALNFKANKIREEAIAAITNLQLAPSR